ncbi:MOSC N-terminal beta barrel domain-containing protein [Hydrogenophaga sp.]|uniref:MOSC domain-containing protein n=1 Tax=Hydrogenophaga sp. TaxID=1904254 RepID=UPI0019A71543|nr:MOSC N-terminal beta barrel domain-containing protein [Hydrogenophaga sp.]MBD3893536.1 MOSC domain-containing protein [Hydrogenophaga sp.]
MNPAAEHAPESQLQIEQLWIYPVKSCAGVALDQVELTDTGLAWDRAWMVIDADGVFVTQRQRPRMALIQPSFKLGELVLRAPGMMALHLSLESAEAALQVRVWDEHVSAYDMGAVAAQWFSDFLGQPLRLVRFDPQGRRACSPAWCGGRSAHTQFADGFSLLLSNQASLDELNARLAQAGVAPVGMARFRPNIVLGGLPAYAEDRLAALHIDSAGGAHESGALIEAVKPCTRCALVDIDPATAEAPSSASPVLQMLQSYRQDPRVDGAASFGMNAIVLAGDAQMLRVGQRVTTQASPAAGGAP